MARLPHDPGPSQFAQAEDACEDPELDEALANTASEISPRPDSKREAREMGDTISKLTILNYLLSLSKQHPRELMYLLQLNEYLSDS